MKKQQILLAAAGLALVSSLYLFGNTTAPGKKAQPGVQTQATTFHFDEFVSFSKKNLTPAQSEYIAGLENSVIRGAVKDQQIKVYHQLAHYWKDSLNQNIPYIGYLSKAARLENSEKSLTFAARNFFEVSREITEPTIKNWMTEEAEALYNSALTINPANDSAKVGLGAVILFSGTHSPMEGIKMIREVAEKDSAFMYAQFMLGYGAVVSQQWDKAIERFSKVIDKEPENAEAVLLLAEAYEQKGDSANARIWYKKEKEMLVMLAKKRNEKVPEEFIKALDERINSLK
ncbi:MAG: tetratricopeptide repeat protein [Sphingobacteriales bacterium]|nr:tetratricopeptide repeat protein [Sphingobacteriales bacterium]MBI3720580.1 tetratricopeptide repeat protein [Sphingobacteriales bacterium]